MASTGQCLCGGVAFSIDAPLAPIQICHCSQCRRAQGTPLVTNIPVPAEHFYLDRGADLLRAYESSPGKRRVFCSNCGSPVYSDRAEYPEVVRVRAGLLDEPVETRPTVHIFATSACSWWPIDDDLPQHPGMAPPAATR